MSETRSVLDLLAMLDALDNDDQCRSYLEELRWPRGLVCPRCGGTTISRIKARKVFDCDGCRYQYSLTAGTLFHDSHLPMAKWFLATYLMCESKKRVSANQLRQMLKVSYKTAWYLSHRIRAAMAEVTSEPLTGTVERDTRGHRQGVRSGSRRNTSKIVAIKQGGNMQIRKAATLANREILHGFLKDTVSGDTARIYADDARGHIGIGDENTTHETVTGSFHRVGVKHLDRYLDEFEFRYINRKNRYLFRDTLLRLCDGRALPYDELTA